MAGNVCSGILGWSTVPLTIVLMPRGTIRRSAVLSIFLYSLLEAGMEQVIRLPASSLSGSSVRPEESNTRVPLVVSTRALLQMEKTNFSPLLNRPLARKSFSFMDGAKSV